MKRIILLLTGIFFISINSVTACEVVYPKTKEYTTDAQFSFFVGSESLDGNPLTINSQEVQLSKTGLFFFPVTLNEGENQFIIENGAQTETYKIIRKTSPAKVAKEPEMIDYEEPFEASVNRDGAPLRSTPYDFGINRLQHFSKGIPLLVVGEFGDFYKVQLARDDYAWILKTDVQKSLISTFDKPAKIENFEYSEDENSRKFVIKLDKQVPYVLSESSGLDFVLYNVIGYPENKYEFHINRMGKDFGYKTYYKDNDELVIGVKNYPKIDKQEPLKGLKITLDAGHGGSELGSISGDKTPEKDINLEITLKLKKVLEDAGAKVFLTRDGDFDISLNERVRESQDRNSDIFISLHNNAFPDSLAYSNKSGTSAYYFYPQSRELAMKVQESLLKKLSSNDDKVRRESFAVIRNTESLAILIELGYMIIPDDFEKLKDENYQQEIAKAIKQGLENFFNDL
jgi:N-acetylmuramoyl-L-alanine amidase